MTTEDWLFIIAACLVAVWSFAWFVLGVAWEYRRKKGPTKSLD